MLSLYDAFSFSVHKKTFMAGFFAGTLFLLLMMGFVWGLGYYLIDIAQVGITGQLIARLTAGTKGFSKFLVKSDPHTLFVVIKAFLILFFVYFTLLLGIFSMQFILAKKALFKLPKSFSLRFFVKTLGRFFLITLPIFLGLFFVFNAQANYLFLSQVAQALNIPLLKASPFSNVAKILISLLMFFYFCYTSSLFAPRYRLRDLGEFKLFSKSLFVFFQMFFGIICIFFIFVFAFWVLLLFYQNFSNQGVAFFFLMCYLFLMILFHPAKIWIILPITVYVGIMGYVYSVGGYRFALLQAWSFLLIVLYFYLCFFVLCAFLGTVAHLICQTGYFYVYRKTPVKDIKKKAPQNLERMEYLYDNYLLKHRSENKENFFHDLK